MLNTYLLVDGSLMLVGLPLLVVWKGRKEKTMTNRESNFDDDSHHKVEEHHHSLLRLDLDVRINLS